MNWKRWGMGAREKNITLSGIRFDEWVNPFGATVEELLAGTLEEGGLLTEETHINGRPASEYFKAFSQKRSRFLESTRLGSILLKAEVITNLQLTVALSHQKKRSLPLGEVLVELGFCTEAAIAEALEKQRNIRVEMERMEMAQSEWRRLWQKLVSFVAHEPSKPEP